MGDGAVDVRLLGGVEVRVDGEPVDLSRSGRARSLLALLILHADAAQARQRLAFEFWPDSNESQARTNLRNLLHTLRRAHPAIDASIEVTATTLQWKPVGAATVDVDRFVAAAHAARGADPDEPGELIARCRTALDLYGGELLAGEYDPWAAARRDELRELYRDLLRRLATALIDHGQAGQAVEVTRRLVSADPLDEAAHRLRIEAHHAAGDRASAVRAYHECAATLRHELGVEPGPATVAAYASVIGSDGGRPGAAVPVRAGLVGRDDEWQWITAAWHAVQHGQPTVVLVTGEPGIGKTRLVDELRAWCTQAGATIAEARSYATEGDLAYGVVTAWLRSPDVHSAARRLPDEQRADLARLLPELGPAPPADALDDAERRRRIFDAAVAAIAAMSQPTLLIADDAQWSDRVSQEFVHYLVRQQLPAPLLVALTARREEIDGGHPLTALSDSLAALDRLAELALERLDRDATGALARELTDAPLDDARVDALFAETEGNPLFVVETVRSNADDRSGATAFSPRLRATIQSRFHRLSDVAATVLGAAAVAARPCSAHMLARVCDLDDRSLARGLDELWQRGILRESGVDAYEFTHGKLRDVAYDEVAPATRRAHHGAIAEVLAAHAAADPELASSQIAMHFEAAHRPDDAITWYLKAALEAQQVAAYPEAVRLLDHALELVPSLPADVRHTRELELLSSMPPALGGAEGYGSNRMHQAHLRASDVAARLGVELDPVVVRSMVMSALCEDRFADAADAAGRLRAHAEAIGDESLRIESHYLLGISAFWAADLHAAREHFEIVVAEFDPATRLHHQDVFGHDPQVVCQSRLANTLWFLGRQGEARRTCEQAFELAADVGHALSRDTAAIFSCLLAIDIGDHDALRLWAQPLSGFALDTLPFSTKHAAVTGLIEVLDGQPSEGITRTRTALEQCAGRNFYPGFQATIAHILVAAHQAAGDAAGGLEACEQAAAIGGTPLWEAEHRRAVAEFLHATGAPAERVEAAIVDAETIARRQGAGAHLRRIDATRRHLGATAAPGAS